MYSGGDGRGRGLCIQVVTEEEEVCVFRFKGEHFPVH